MSEPLTGEQVALLQQEYIKLLIESDEMFNNVNVIAEDEGNVESQMDKALGIVTNKDGAAGACVVIRQPNGSDEMPGVQWPPLMLEWDILCLEWREMNKDTAKGGTGKRAWHLARRIHRIIKVHQAPAISHAFTTRRPSVIRSSFAREINGIVVPLVGYTVRVAAMEADDTHYTKVALPALSGTPALTPGSVLTGSVGTELTATCSTSGAAIYYTTDLSNPCSQNATAILYAGPITTVEATYMFRAFATGNIGSDSIAASFS